MVIDTSAFVAVLYGEPERARFNELIVASPRCLVSAASYVETGIVLTSRYGPLGYHQLLVFVTQAGIVVRPVDQEQADLAVGAYARYGKGRHEAGLNYGDCFSYALARVTGEPLLFKGDDFVATDIEPVWRPR